MQITIELPRRAGVAGSRMRRALLSHTPKLTLLGAVLSLLGACGQPSPPVSDDGWHMLLDGSNLTFWNIVGDANWRVEDGSVVADQSTASSFLVSQESYANFDLELEFWVNTEANSGVFLRCRDPESISEESCYEVNIFDTRADQTYRTGGIVNLAAPAEFVYTGGQWNRFAIRANGSRLQVTLNGRDLVDVEDARLSGGPIALQYGMGTVRFRNVRIRPL